MSRSGSVGIAGVGLIGASIGLRARACGLHVTGFDVSKAHLDLARAGGALDDVAASSLDLAGTCETLVIATPLEETLRLVHALALDPPAATLVLDVASVKCAVLEAAAGLANFVGTHPIAGSERSGPGAASADLFAGHAWAYVRVAPELDRRAAAFIELMGARPIAVDAAEHDRIVAATSHLPQVLSVALAASLAERLAEDLPYALSGTGLRSMTRLAASAWSMWRGILACNGPSVAQEVRRLAAILASVADELERRDAQALGERFTVAATAARRLHENDSDPMRVP